MIEHFERTLEAYRAWKIGRLPGALGDYYRAGGNRLLYENLPIGSGATVIDAGGYQGAWADQVLIRYGARVHIFEPVPEYAEILQEKYQFNRLVLVQAAALGAANRKASLKIDNAGSTIVDSAKTGAIEVSVLDIAEVVAGLACEEIAALKLNVEGAEYEILDRLLETGTISRFNSLLLQFHNVAGDSQGRMERIQRELKRTHDCLFSYPFVWDYWVASNVARD